MQHRREWLALAASSVFAFAPATGQTMRLASATVRSYSLSGTITDLEGQPLSGADVALLHGDSIARRVHSDTSGKFLMSGIPSLAPTILVRHMGFQPRTLNVRIHEAEGTSSIVVALEEMATELETVHILDYMEDPDARLRDYMQRKLTNNFGHYIDGERIEERRPAYLSEMLRGVPGVTLLPSRRMGNLVKVRGCSPLVWIDGVRMPDAELDEVARPGDIAAMEVYNSYAGIPAQFFDRTATCGTIVLWTRSR